MHPSGVFFLGLPWGAGLGSPPPPPHPAPVCVGSWENAEINKYAIRQASSHGGGERGVGGGAAKRGSGQILECLRKRPERRASTGLWASHRRSPPGGEGAAAAPEEEEEEEEGGWQLPALLSGVFPPIGISQSPGQGMFVLEAQ